MTRASGGMREAIPAIAVTLLMSTSAFAQWKVQDGKKFTPFPPATGKIATLPAKAPHNGVSAYLEIECFSHPQLTELSFGIVLSKDPPNGFMAHTIQFDEAPPVVHRPYSRSLPANRISLTTDRGSEIEKLAKAKNLKLTLLPADGSKPSDEFDTTGAANAIQGIPCQKR